MHFVEVDVLETATGLVAQGGADCAIFGDVDIQSPPGDYSVSVVAILLDASAEKMAPATGWREAGIGVPTGMKAFRLDGETKYGLGDLDVAATATELLAHSLPPLLRRATEQLKAL